MPVGVWHLGALSKEDKILSDYESGRVRFDALRISDFVLGYDGADQYAAGGAGLPFSDVKTGDWFYGDVLWAYANGFATGVSDRFFLPGDSVTRATIVTVLHRMAGEPSVAGNANLPADVGSGDWFRAPISWATANGLVSGGGAYFEPNAPISRQELAAMLLNFAVYEKKAAAGDAPAFLDFADADAIDSYAAPGVAWCYEAGVVLGRPGKIFDPKVGVSRAEMLAFLHRYALIS
jgi:hypothetical protein